MPNQNSDLHNAKISKNDEFYTQIGDIEKEMDHYDPRHFKDKIVYCNCDDPKESKFYQHFKQKFDDYGLKELITTCYQSDDLLSFSKHNSETSLGLRYDGKRSLSRWRRRLPQQGMYRISKRSRHRRYQSAVQLVQGLYRSANKIRKTVHNFRKYERVREQRGFSFI